MRTILVVAGKSNNDPANMRIMFEVIKVYGFGWPVFANKCVGVVCACRRGLVRAVYASVVGSAALAGC